VSNLHNIASDLAAFLTQVAERSPIKVEVATAKPTTVLSDETLARAVFDYVCSQLKEDDPPEVIGEALVIGANALARDAQLSGDRLTEEMIDLLERIVEAARGVA
jgi:hypothetical protein